MADEAGGTDQDTIQHLYNLQSMIDVSAERLEGLRTQCATSDELTQQEIRTLESKLIKMFSDLLVTKSKLKNGFVVRDLPSLTQWLKVVGLGPASIYCICQKIVSVEELQEKSTQELEVVLNENGPNSEELDKLCRALHNLKIYSEMRRGDKDTSDLMLHWDSWDRHRPPSSYSKGELASAGQSPRTIPRNRAARASVPSEESLLQQFSNNNNNQNRGGALLPPSASVSNINSLNAQCMLGPPLTPPGGISQRGKGMTPPAKRKHNIQPALLPEYPLTKSKSHESQLAASKSENTQANDSSFATGNGAAGVRRARLPTEPGPDAMPGYSTPISSPIKSPPFNKSSYNTTDSDDSSYKSINLAVPKSPRTPTTLNRVMTHQINHRFTKTFKVRSTCSFCLKSIVLITGLTCKECKYTCHKECEDKVEPSCCLPPAFLDEFKKKLSIEGGSAGIYSPSTGRANTKNIKNPLKQRKRSYPQPSINVAAFPPPDSSSNTSSCNSSTPSSPAVQAINTPHASNLKQPQFHFPEISHSDIGNEVTLETRPLSINSNLNQDLTSSQTSSKDGGGGSIAGTVSSNNSDRTASISGSTSTDSDRTPVRVDSQDSQVSDTETITDGHQWPRQNSLSLREWDIPYHELKIGDVIGTGRFGTVFRGQWHGDVAIKVLNVQDEKTLEHFRNEVATYRKTRHENVILFMGACMKPPELAIVTSLSKGLTLYTHIHLRKDKFNMNKTTIIAQQISQGMGYLHAKGIVHKDLKSKNIFLENGKVVIADFGLFSFTKLGSGKKNCSLSIPSGWLCYLAPEIMRKLHAHESIDEELSFSKASDVYAFGTVWYELLCGVWPFKSQPPEAIIWQVGKGMKQPLANLQASRDVKDILMLCWSFRPEERPDFIRLLNILNKLPKKRLARSPSHPIHLSRSAESVF